MRVGYKLASILMVLFLVLVFSFELIATENIQINLSAKEIIKKMDDGMRGTTSHAVYTMKITNPKWQRTLKMKNWWISREARSSY